MKGPLWAGIFLRLKGVLGQCSQGFPLVVGFSNFCLLIPVQIQVFLWPWRHSRDTHSFHKPFVSGQGWVRGVPGESKMLLVIAMKK